MALIAVSVVPFSVSMNRIGMILASGAIPLTSESLAVWLAMMTEVTAVP